MLFGLLTFLFATVILFHVDLLHVVFPFVVCCDSSFFNFMLLNSKGVKLGQHSHGRLVWVSFMLIPKHPLSGADPESYFNLRVVTVDTNQ